MRTGAPARGELSESRRNKLDIRSKEPSSMRLENAAGLAITSDVSQQRLKHPNLMKWPKCSLQSVEHSPLQPQCYFSCSSVASGHVEYGQCNRLKT